MDVQRPPALLHRDAEWEALVDFVADARPGATLGLVYGRRRQGKTLLLEALTHACGGFMFSSLQQSAAQNLTDISGAYAHHSGAPQARFGHWRDAIDALLRLGERSADPLPVVLDEFPYLVAAEPALPSIIQAALSPLGRARQQSMARLILCGSAVATMRSLLSASAPLRGRAFLELLVRPFDYREAAAFWGVDADPELAFRLHCLVGGTPAYREMCAGPPDRLADFDRWVARRLLAPPSAMFMEGDVLLHGDTDRADPTLYYAVLAAIVRGACRRSEIAAVLARKDAALTHPLTMLERTQIVERLDDALRQRRPVYRITEPVVRLSQLLIRPNEARLIGGAARQVWSEAADTVASLIHGPHLEELARTWCLLHAEPGTLGGRAGRVQPTVLPCPAHRQGHQLDLVATEIRPHAGDRVIAIGEVKATRRAMDLGELHRLEHLRALLPAASVGAPPRLLLFGRGGFETDLVAEAGRRPDVELIDLTRLYEGG
jgi:AAA+ ATPase superfamily predicted ATPase